MTQYSSWRWKERGQSWGRPGVNGEIKRKKRGLGIWGLAAKSAKNTGENAG